MTKSIPNLKMNSKNLSNRLQKMIRLEEKFFHIDTLVNCCTSIGSYG